MIVPDKLNEPATGRQLHTITLLCLKLNIHELLEEQAMTKGQAGSLIQQLAGARSEHAGPSKRKSREQVADLASTSLVLRD